MLCAVGNERAEINASPRWFHEGIGHVRDGLLVGQYNEGVVYSDGKLAPSYLSSYPYILIS